MLAWRLKGHQVDYVDDAYFDLRDMGMKQLHRRERLKGWYVSAAGHYYVGFRPLVVGRPFPNADSRRAMFYCVIHREPLRRGLFAGDYYVDVVAASEAVVGNGKQAIGIGRKIDPHYLCFLVDYVIDEAGVLVRKPVMVLTPDV